MQTRIFEAPPDKVLQALKEWCAQRGNGGIRESPSNYEGPHASKWSDFRGSCLGIQPNKVDLFFVEVRLASELNNKRTTIRLLIEKRARSNNPDAPYLLLPSGRIVMVNSHDASDYDFVFRSIADYLALNEVGVEIKVFR